MRGGGLNLSSKPNIAALGPTQKNCRLKREKVSTYVVLNGQISEPILKQFFTIVLDTEINVRKRGYF